MSERLKIELDHISEDLWRISDELYANPELGDEEFESMKKLIQLLEKHRFVVETGTGGRPTSFRAEYRSENPGPTVAFLAEYDALPEVGHGCGHNLIGTMSTGAGIVLSKLLDKIGGNVVVLGTSAEETNGAKVPMSTDGTFDDIDVAMILHPNGVSQESGSSLAIDALEFKYTGKTSHAAASPEKGINALDSVIQLFNGINALREHLPSDVRLHGVIPEGGQAANVVPDLAVAHFYFRSKSRKTLDETTEKIKHIAEGAALMTGSKLEISNYEISYDEMVPNRILSDVFTKHLKQITGEKVLPAEHTNGSMDMGNVSRVVPAIHPMIGLDDASLVLHTREFADKTVTSVGKQALLDGALSLASTGYDVITDEDLLKDIKEEFKQFKK